MACESFCLDENDMVKDAKKALGTMPLTEETVRFGKPSGSLTLKSALEAGFRKQLISCTVKESKMLGDFTADRATIFVDMEPQVSTWKAILFAILYCNCIMYIQKVTQIHVHCMFTFYRKKWNMIQEITLELWLVIEKK